MSLRYGSVCSGIEAATVAWHSLGWCPQWFAEIEPFPSAVLAHHYPEVPNHGDFTRIGSDAAPIDLLVGGTPCQSFSVAGLRGGLDDDRGNLALEFLRLAERTRARWLVWENVPGVLSSGRGRDFGSILGGLVELGYGFAYRVLDAQYFGVPQRRRRVFVVGHLGDWRAAAAVLFERASLRGDSAPSREARERVAPTLAARTRGGGGLGTDFDLDGGLIAAGGGSSQTLSVAPALTRTGGRFDFDTECFVAGTLCANGKATGSATSQDADSGFLLPVAHTLKAEGFDASEDRTGRGTQVTSLINRSNPKPGDPCHTLAKASAARARVATGMAVRRLTPRECERLQGFPDDYTAIPWKRKPASECPDGPRYKALGNSMAVPVMRWIGERIELVERELASEAA